MNDIELFHVSLIKYDNDTVLKLTGNDETHYYKRKREIGDNWVDDTLNTYRPLKAPFRQQTFYAFDAIENCIAFATTNNLRNPYYYKVKMQSPTKAPMCLTDLILKSKGDLEKIKKIVQEYWNPQNDWKFNEYLSIEMSIIESIQEPDFFAKLKGKENYNHDYDIENKLFK
jgi:hypothetical protein